jgi:hypothetical protein
MEYTKLSDERLSRVLLKFYHTTICNDKTKTRLYNIDVSTGFSEHKYYIIEILSDDKSYKYDLLYPGGAVTQIIQKRKICN